MMKHTVATVELILELIMNFAKSVSEFRDLLPEDKVILLQVGINPLFCNILYELNIQ